MSVYQAVIVYAVCWWMLLFMALPIGITHKQAPMAGADAGAPDQTYLWIKCAAVTVMAAFATWGIDLLVNSGIVEVR